MATQFNLSRGRPSVHPERIAYHESPEIVGAMRALAADQGLRFCEVQRLVNRRGLEALQAA